MKCTYYDTKSDEIKAAINGGLDWNEVNKKAVALTAAVRGGSLSIGKRTDKQTEKELNEYFKERILREMRHTVLPRVIITYYDPKLHNEWGDKDNPYLDGSIYNLFPATLKTYYGEIQRINDLITEIRSKGYVLIEDKSAVCIKYFKREFKPERRGKHPLTRLMPTYRLFRGCGISLKEIQSQF